MRNTTKDSSESFLKICPYCSESCSKYQERQKTLHIWILRKSISVTIIILLSYIAVILTITFVNKDHFAPYSPTVPYSPANSALTYERRPIWDEDPSPWARPPSPATDKAWDSLLSFQNIRVSAAEFAAQNENLTNRVQLPNGDYMGSLGVWHQIHCLDILRRALHMDYYSRNLSIYDHPKDMFIVEHYDHCIETLRRSVMCHADLGLYSFEWVRDSREARNKVLKSNAETFCVDWGRLKEWAGKRALRPGQFKLKAGPFEKSHEHES